jgi:PhnB protein
MVMIESEWPGFANRAPVRDGSSPVALYVYVDDVDATVERAVANAAKVLMPPTDQFWGDRTAWILDPQGHVWTVATRTAETTEAERRRRLEEINARTRDERT